VDKVLSDPPLRHDGTIWLQCSAASGVAADHPVAHQQGLRAVPAPGAQPQRRDRPAAALRGGSAQDGGADQQVQLVDPSYPATS
jgi:hypothetical protein